MATQRASNSVTSWVTPFTLPFYDVLILRISVPFIWRYSTQKQLRPLFSDNFSKRHIDIGVGTGYFPTKAMGDVARNPKDQHLTLVDLSEHALAAARQRVQSKYPEVHVECVHADAAKPMPDSLQDKRFDSASLFLIMHHMPSPTATKATVITNTKNLLTDDGVLVGCTILGKQWEKTEQGYKVKNEKPLGRRAAFMLGFYNKRGIFDNWEDDPNVLANVLKDEFEEVETKVVAMMFVFKASKPRK
ncbi:methyltransferase protein [Fusarium austroafricanum]|uniref:Methyltransferase protein n=1 Tax=Fusarium austroafricanum TaxID=2364996 RepID=A0A8H4K8Z1_9HYPO|nr:methyltransferase protein [Fusarium austroafricanum]